MRNHRGFRIEVRYVNREYSLFNKEDCFRGSGAVRNRTYQWKGFNYRP